MTQLRNILYVAEEGTAPGAALARAVSLAENNQAELVVMDVVPYVRAGIGMPLDTPVFTDLQSAMVSKRTAELEAQVASCKLSRDIRIVVKVGQRALEIIRSVMRDQYDLVIKPVSNPDFIERLFGSVDMQLLRMCPCPVWLAGPNEKPKYERILATVDFDQDKRSESADASINRQIQELASSIALSDFSELRFVHVWDAPAELMLRSWTNNPEEVVKIYVDGEYARHEEAFDDFRDQLLERLGQEAYDHLAPRFYLRRGTAARVIPEVASQLQADLVVMGTAARTGIAGLFIGNTAEDVLEQLQCSVLAVKPEGFVSPVKLAD